MEIAFMVLFMEEQRMQLYKIIPLPARSGRLGTRRVIPPPQSHRSAVLRLVLRHPCGRAPMAPPSRSAGSPAFSPNSSLTPFCHKSVCKCAGTYRNNISKHKDKTIKYSNSEK